MSRPRLRCLAVLAQRLADLAAHSSPAWARARPTLAGGPAPWRPQRSASSDVLALSQRCLSWASRPSHQRRHQHAHEGNPDAGYANALERFLGLVKRSSLVQRANKLAASTGTICRIEDEKLALACRDMLRLAADKGDFRVAEAVFTLVRQQQANGINCFMNYPLEVQPLQLLASREKTDIPQYLLIQSHARGGNLATALDLMEQQAGLRLDGYPETASNTGQLSPEQLRVAQSFLRGWWLELCNVLLEKAIGAKDVQAVRRAEALMQGTPRMLAKLFGDSANAPIDFEQGTDKTTYQRLRLASHSGKPAQVMGTWEYLSQKQLENDVVDAAPHDTEGTNATGPVSRRSKCHTRGGQLHALGAALGKCYAWEEALTTLRELSDLQHQAPGDNSVLRYLKKTYDELFKSVGAFGPLEVMNTLLAMAREDGIERNASMCHHHVKNILRQARATRLRSAKIEHDSLISLAEHVIDSYVMEGVGVELRTFSALALEYARERNSVAALDLLERLTEEGMYLDTIFYNAVVKSVAPNLGKGLQLAREMKKKGILGDEVTFVTLFGMCGSHGNVIANVHEVEDFMERCKWRRHSVKTFAAMLQAHASSGNLDELVKRLQQAITLENQLRSQATGGAAHDVSTVPATCGGRLHVLSREALNIALAAAARAGAVRLGEKIVDELWSQFDCLEAPDLYTYSALLNLYAVAGDTGKLFDVFDRIVTGEVHDVPLSTDLCNVAIKGMLQENTEQALDVLDMMFQRDIGRDHITYMTLLKHAARKRKEDVFFETVDKMERDCVLPSFSDLVELRQMLGTRSLTASQQRLDIAVRRVDKSMRHARAKTNPPGPEDVGSKEDGTAM
eukprot:scaffold1233_cov395-Prasinococcus_capsulatus_cf.AAC.18